MSEYFEFKYLAIKGYNEYYFEMGYTHAQSADRCLYEFERSMSGNVIREIAVYTTILYQYVRKDTKIHLFDLEYKYLMELYNGTNC